MTDQDRFLTASGVRAYLRDRGIRKGLRAIYAMAEHKEVKTMIDGGVLYFYLDSLMDRYARLTVPAKREFFRRGAHQ